MICFCFGDGGHDCYVVALGTDVVSRGDDGDVNVCGFVTSVRIDMSDNSSIQHTGSGRNPFLTVLATNLRLRNDQLCRVAIVGVGHGMRKYANRLDQMPYHLDLSWKVARIAQDLGGFGTELHAFGIVASFLHCSLDAGDFASVVGDFIDGSIKHVGTPVDGT